MTDTSDVFPPTRHLLVGTPCYGGNVTHLYMTSIMQLQKLCLVRGIPFQVQLLSGDALITRARNSIVTQFLDNASATHLMFIDADIGFDAEAVFRMLDFDQDLVGGIYPAKNVDWDKVQANADKKHPNLRAASMNYVVGFENRQQIASVGTFAKARYLGNGFMLIKRRVFELMKEKYPHLRYEKINASPDVQRGSPNRYAFFECVIDDEGFYLPEDYTFCKRWTDIGGEMWADTSSKLTHLGPYAFVGDTSVMFDKADE
jgi:hypothetical protein